MRSLAVLTQDAVLPSISDYYYFGAGNKKAGETTWRFTCFLLAINEEYLRIREPTPCR
jgi:hypothetical protein